MELQTIKGFQVIYAFDQLTASREVHSNVICSLPNAELDSLSWKRPVKASRTDTGAGRSVSHK